MTRLARLPLLVTGLLTLAGLGLAVGSPAVAASQAFPIRIVDVTSHLRPGQSGDIYAQVKAQMWCTVDFASPRYARGTLREKPFKTTTGVVDIGFKVRSRAAGGRWRYALGCARTAAGAAKGHFVAVKRSHLWVSTTRANARGAITSALIAHSIGTMPAGGDGKGSDAFPAEGSVLIYGSQWFGGRGVNVMSSGRSGSATSVWQCVELVKRFMNQRFGVPIRAYGDAKYYWNNSALGPYVDQHDNGSGYQPVPGDIVVDTTGNYGHVQIVDANSGGTLTLVDQNSSSTGWATATLQSSGLWRRSNGDTTIHFLHIKANGTANPPAPAQPPTAVTAPSTTTHTETTGSLANTWTNYASAGGTAGPTIPANTSVQIACKVSGYKVSDGNTAWYQIASSPWNRAYYVSADAFYNNGATSGSLHGTPFADASVPDCTPGAGTSSPQPPTSTPAPSTHGETTGSVANTWTNYSNAGGTQGPSIGSNQTVQIACKVGGFRVSDGNAWWYRIASAPWNNGYYVSADAFYNNGATSGSLQGTPFVDPAVPDC